MLWTQFAFCSTSHIPCLQQQTRLLIAEEMSDDDDELAELRAQRAARTGQISLVSRSPVKPALLQQHVSIIQALICPLCCRAPCVRSWMTPGVQDRTTQP